MNTGVYCLTGATSGGYFALINLCGTGTERLKEMKILNINQIAVRRISRHLPVIICSLIAVSIPLSCATITTGTDAALQDQIKAENRIMRQNLTLAVRENEIVKNENLQYKGDNSKLKSRVKLLESEIASLNKKHTEDIALLNEKYDNLSQKNRVLEKESSDKLKELTDINKALENKLSSEIARLNEDMRKQQIAFNKERSGIETQFSAKELEYQKQAAVLNKELMAARTDLEALKSKLAEADATISGLNKKLDNANSELSAKDKTISELKTKIESLTPAANAGDNAVKKEEKAPDEKR